MGGYAVWDTDASLDTGAVSGTASDLFAQLFHSYLLFDTSSLGSSVVISSSVFSGYYIYKLNDLGSPDLHLAASNPASNTGLVVADFPNVSRTSFGSITYANFTASQYNNITLNASGISNISKTGISKFSLQLSWDLNNSFGGTWIASSWATMNINSAETAGTSQDPKLVVTYTVVIPPKQDVIWFD